VIQSFAGARYRSSSVEADVWRARDVGIGSEPPILFGVKDDHGLIAENSMSAKGDIPIRLDVHPKPYFAFEELTFFIDKTQQDDFGIEGLTAGDDEALEAVDLGAAGRRDGRWIVVVGFEDIVVLSQCLHVSEMNLGRNLP